MKSFATLAARAAGIFGLLAALGGLGGCGAGLTTYPGTGKVVLEQGDAKLPSGISLYCRQEEDPMIGATGTIKQDGSFSLVTMSNGKILTGSPQGTYRTTIVTEDVPKNVLLKKIPMDPRMLDMKNTPLTFTVPTTGEVVLTIPKAKAGAKAH